MPVNRKLWNEEIAEASCPEGWHCPSCAGGYLGLLKDSLRYSKSAATIAEQNEIYFEAEHVQLRFSALLQCHNDRCKESVAISGFGGYHEEPDEAQAHLVWTAYFKPLFVHPPLHFIRIPESTPEEVRTPLTDSFGLLWASPSSAANQVRSAVENLLTELGVPRRHRTKKGGIDQYTLHKRIDLLKDRELSRAGSQSRIADALLAVKWIGNAGSHLDKLTRDDVFDAYDIVETVLDDLYAKNREAMQKLIRQINRRKGPKAKTVKSNGPC